MSAKRKQKQKRKQKKKPGARARIRESKTDARAPVHAAPQEDTRRSRKLHRLFGAEVRRHRAELGMSLETLAKLSGLTPNYIGRLERGLVNPALSTITAVAVGLGADLGELLGMMAHLSPSAVRMAQLLDQAPTQVRRGVLTLLRGAAKKKPAGSS